jgi:hypothetical protein
MKARIVNGASFCQVAKIMHDIHDNEVMTEGNQKWNGAIPNFNRIAEISIIFSIIGGDEDHCDILVISITLDPIA